MYERCEIPSPLKFFFHLDYSRSLDPKSLYIFWDKLKEALLQNVDQQNIERQQRFNRDLEALKTKEKAVIDDINSSVKVYDKTKSISMSNLTIPEIKLTSSSPTPSASSSLLSTTLTRNFETSKSQSNLMEPSTHPNGSWKSDNITIQNPSKKSRWYKNILSPRDRSKEKKIPSDLVVENTSNASPNVTKSKKKTNFFKKKLTAEFS